MRHRSLPIVATLLTLTTLAACAHDGETEGLALERVVLYRNGVGYFERGGEVSGDVLTIKCRKDQINDVLKSLTVVDRGSGQALSVSMPLDPQSWANAALATLAPGSGNLAQVLDALRGTRVTLGSSEVTVTGRIMMVELVQTPTGKTTTNDHRITVMDGDELHVILLSKVETVTFSDDELALQLHRSLDASAGEGMFKEVEVDVRLSTESDHDLSISYVVSAPMWKPTYRVVLPTDPEGRALLQGWAVVDNTSGEDWTDVSLSLTSGAPIAFRYDLHTPITLGRPDMTAQGTARRARVAVGETTYDEEPAEAMAEAKPMAKPAPAPRTATTRGPGGGASGGLYKRSKSYDFDDDVVEGDLVRPDGAMVMEDLERSTRTNAKAKTVSGLTRFELLDRVTVPEGSSTMVAILNKTIEADQAFLFKPGGSGPGFETNPYRIVRFKNETPFVLEPGPIAIYAGGSFVGEGISETIASGASATIPFSVDPTISVTSKTASSSGEVRLLKISKGVLYTETFERWVTTWTAKSQKREHDIKILLRHTRRGNNYDLESRPDGTEDLTGAYLVPLYIKAGKTEASLALVEQTPSRANISIWTGGALKAFESLLATSNLPPAARTKLEPIVKLRRAVADIDARTANLKRRQVELDHRANETRANLEAIKKDPAAGNLRARLSKRLEEFTKEGDAIGREIVELTSKRLEKKIELDEMLENFTFEAPKPTK